MVGDDQRAQRILRGDPAGVADDVRFSGLQPQELLHRQPRVHAGQHRQLARRRHGQIAQLELFRILLVVL